MYFVQGDFSNFSLYLCYVTFFSLIFIPIKYPCIQDIDKIEKEKKKMKRNRII